MPAGSENKIMHASFRIGGSSLMASDGYCKGAPSFQGISLSLVAENAGEAEGKFKALSEGGSANMPFSKTFFSKGFGMCVDQFGIPWMVNCPLQD